MMQNEGASVQIYVKDPFFRKIMGGIVPHVNSVEDGLKNRPDFVLFDTSGNGVLADKIKKDGFNVIGSSEFADRLELDRSYGAKVSKQYGIACPETVEFKNIEQALEYVKKNDKPLAIKVDNSDCIASSYVSKDKEDMLSYISYQKEKGLLDGATFVLQDKIDGSEVSTECWFSNGIPCFPSNSTWETKKLFAGELGVRTGCETSAVCHYENRTSKLAEQTVLKLAPLLKYSRYTGPFDVNAIVSDKDHKPYFLEFTPRIGYSAIYAFAAMLGMPLSEFFYKVSRGTFSIPFKSKWATSLKMNIPPYPFYHDDENIRHEAYKPTEGIRISGKISPDFIPVDVRKGKKTKYESAGTAGDIGECIGRGKTLMEAWRGSQKVFKDIEVPNGGGRYTDGIEDAWKRIIKLRSWGYTDIPHPSSGQISPGVRTFLTPYDAKAPGN